MIPLRSLRRNPSGAGHRLIPVRAQKRCYGPILHVIDNYGRSSIKPSHHAQLRILAPRIAQIVHNHLDAVALQGRMDVIKDLANPLPIIVIAELLGVPIQDQG